MSISKQHVVIGLCLVIALAVTSVGGFYYGSQKQANEVQVLKAEMAQQSQGYASGIATVQNERNRALNDFEAACLEYQELRTAYDTLYAKTGAASGQPKYSSPDDARGNEDSCYR